jgi:hypothetical protein
VKIGESRPCRPPAAPLYLERPRNSLIMSAVSVATFVAVLLTMMISAIGAFGPFGLLGATMETPPEIHYRIFNGHRSNLRKVDMAEVYAKPIGNYVLASLIR